MKYLGTNFIAKIKAWINANFTTKAAFEQHAVWAKGEGENSIVVAGNGIPNRPTAMGARAIAEGSGTASGDFSHAEGNGTATGMYSHAEGSGTASEYYSHAEGSATKAQGMYSHAEGCDTKAIGIDSHAEGWLTTAKGPGSHAEGYHNVENSNCIHSVGIGEGRYDRSGKNAEYIYMLAKDDYNWQDDPKNGYKYLIGVGGYDGVSTDTTQYKSVQEVFADLTSRIEALEAKLADTTAEEDKQTN